ncbi:hypothetical protein J437_LFUL004944 [Ladona fulva]|uniref:Reverse transcriptase domain-containing protein n=1 Tax=Ladona fulva TaxID=123851 RepID=A0A8K0KRF0_LADFU|nr:hypothetical protein J437_LFUL004944 [Ladona fulva]
MKNEDYHEKIRTMLNDSAYREITRDPTEAITGKTSALLKKSGLPAETCQSLIPQAAVPPRLYGLPKVHKEGIPLRPIVNGINSPTYLLARYLSKLLTPLIGESNRAVKNSAEFVTTLKQLKLDNGGMLVSFDVVSLFTKVPIQESLILIEEKLGEEITPLFRHALTSNYFLYQGKRDGRIGNHRQSKRSFLVKNDAVLTGREYK